MKTTKLTATYNMHDDVEALYSSLHEIDESLHATFCSNQLELLQKTQTAVTHSAVDLAYMRKVWLLVLAKVQKND